MTAFGSVVGAGGLVIAAASAAFCATPSEKCGTPLGDSARQPLVRVFDANASECRDNNPSGSACNVGAIGFLSTFIRWQFAQPADANRALPLATSAGSMVIASSPLGF